MTGEKTPTLVDVVAAWQKHRRELLILFDYFLSFQKSGNQQKWFEEMNKKFDTVLSEGSSQESSCGVLLQRLTTDMAKAEAERNQKLQALIDKHDITFAYHGCMAWLGELKAFLSAGFCEA